MKKSLLLAFLIGILGGLFGSVGYSLAKDKGWIQTETSVVAQPQDDASDVTLVPTFSSIEDLIEYHNNCVVQFYEDSVFRCMSADILSNVAKVVLKKYGHTTITAIVDEYLTNKLIYNTINQPDNKAPSLNPDANLTEDIAPTNPNLVQNDKVAPKNKNDTGEYQIVDTTIDGKSVKLAKKI